MVAAVIDCSRPSECKQAGDSGLFYFMSFDTGDNLAEKHGDFDRGFNIQNCKPAWLPHFFV
ncbi:hypothetical protein CU100_00175 [Phyllobacterium endophyticum]|uniref:Uncharacterized protein n=1 Tax=Phyllobacterium endophyticum TaxID=1149773 RepID=A0A2P7AYI0_9HYPH|nr:hypothetical protein CU100_00175 [Phyllobacterium endophyticum]